MAEQEEALVEEILGDARKKTGRSQRRADREAKNVVEQAEKEAEKIRSSAAEAARERAEREKKIILATVDIDARRIELDIEEQVIEQAFESALAQLQKKDAYDYQAALAQLIAAAADVIGGGDFRVTLSEEDAATIDLESIAQTVSERFDRSVSLTATEDPAYISGGAVVYSGDGQRMVDNSFEGRLERMRQELRRQAAGILLDENQQ
jgi:V/A-type H+-transporting ATPase subunit E